MPDDFSDGLRRPLSNASGIYIVFGAWIEAWHWPLGGYAGSLVITRDRVQVQRQTTRFSAAAAAVTFLKVKK